MVKEKGLSGEKGGFGGDKYNLHSAKNGNRKHNPNAQSASEFGAFHNRLAGDHDDDAAQETPDSMDPSHYDMRRKGGIAGLLESDYDMGNQIISHNK